MFNVMTFWKVSTQQSLIQSEAATSQMTKDAREENPQQFFFFLINRCNPGSKD